MEKEEKYIEATFGRKAPFKVPEGYFDNFASSLMERLPEQGKQPQVQSPFLRPPVWVRWRKVIVVSAASLLVAMLGVGAYLQHEGAASEKERVAHAAPSSSYSSMDALTDYAMLDSDDMYAYMADVK